MQEKTMTIYDIAKEAGVSPATVSRVLTGNARVKEDKKEKILSIIKICKIKELRIFIFKNFIKKIYNMRI